MTTTTSTKPKPEPRRLRHRLATLGATTLAFTTYMLTLRIAIAPNRNSQLNSIPTWISIVVPLLAAGTIWLITHKIRNWYPTPTPPSLRWLFLLPLTAWIVALIPAADNPKTDATLLGAVVLLSATFIFLLGRIIRGTTRLIATPVQRGHHPGVWVLILLDIAWIVSVTVCVALGATADFDSGDLGNLPWVTRALVIIVLAREIYRLDLLRHRRYYRQAQVNLSLDRFLWTAVPVIIYIASATVIPSLFSSSQATANAFLVLSCILIITQALNAVYMPTVPDLIQPTPTEPLPHSQGRQIRYNQAVLVILAAAAFAIQVIL